MTEKRKFKLKKLINDAPAKHEHRFSSKEGGKIVVHSKRQSQQITPHVENAHATLTRKKRKLIRPRRKWKTQSIVICVFLSLVAVVGIVLLIHYYQVKKLEERTEAYLLQQARNAAQETLPGFAAPLKALSNMATRADALMSNVAETVQFVTDRPLEQFVSSVARRTAWLKEQQERAEEEATQEGAASPDSPEGEEEATEEPEEPETPITINGRDAPMGFETEHIRPQRTQPGTPAPTRDAPELPGVSSEGRDAPAGIDPYRREDTPPSTSHPINFDTDPEVVKLARKAKSANESIHELHHKLETLYPQALDLESDALAAKLSTAARKKVQEMEKLIEDAKDLASRGETELTALSKLTDNIRRVGIEEKQKRTEAAEAERKRKEAEAYKALVSRERESVQQAYEAIKRFIPLYDFSAAVDHLKFAGSQLKTKEAKDALRPFLDRMNKLANTKEDMITNLNKAHYRWGWGKGIAALDIIGADESTVWIPGKKIEWTEVPFAQFTKMLRYYVDQPQDKLSVRAERALAMAILFSESDMAKEAAELAALAVQLTDTMQDEVDRLLPNL